MLIALVLAQVIFDYELVSLISEQSLEDLLAPLLQQPANVHFACHHANDLDLICVDVHTDGPHQID